MRSSVTILLAALVVILMSVANVYRSVPLVELKRRARGGDDFSKSIYKVVVYGPIVQALLITAAAFSSAGFLILVVKHSPLWLALASCVAVILLGYVWIPISGVNIVSQYIAMVLAGPLGWLLRTVHPLTNPASKRLSAFAAKRHTGLFEKDDVSKLIEKQTKQRDNRVGKLELEMLKNVLTFNDKKISNVMIKRKKVATVSIEDTLGPVVLSELYKSGYSFFPVHANKPSNIVGILDLGSVPKDKESPKVRDVMSRRVYYAHEDELLSEALQTIMVTHQPMLIVVNSFEDYVGIITTREIIAELVGDTIIDEFTDYESREKVVAHFTQPKEPKVEKKENESTEVIE